MDDVQYLWDGGRFVAFSGGFQGLKKKRRMTKGVFLSPGVESRIFPRSLVCYLVPSMMSLPSLPVGPALSLAQGRNNLDLEFPQPQT